MAALSVLVRELQLESAWGQPRRKTEASSTDGQVLPDVFCHMAKHWGDRARQTLDD